MVKNNENAIKEAAYYLWENAGRPMGQDEYFWSLAVAQFSNNCFLQVCHFRQRQEEHCFRQENQQQKFFLQERFFDQKIRKIIAFF